MQKLLSSSLLNTLSIRAYLLLIIKAAITPGTHPKRVNIQTRINEPQPLSIIAKGGKKTHNTTLQIDIIVI